MLSPPIHLYKKAKSAFWIFDIDQDQRLFYSNEQGETLKPIYIAIKSFVNCFLELWTININALNSFYIIKRNYLIWETFDYMWNLYDTNLKFNEIFSYCYKIYMMLCSFCALELYWVLISSYSHIMMKVETAFRMFDTDQDGYHLIIIYQCSHFFKSS